MTKDPTDKAPPRRFEALERQGADERKRMLDMSRDSWAHAGVPQALMEAAFGVRKAGYFSTTKPRIDALHAVEAHPWAADQAEDDGTPAYVNLVLFGPTGTGKSLLSAVWLYERITNGNTTPAWTGYEPLATAVTSLIYTALPDAISEGVSVMQVAGFNPDTVYLNPADWLAITVAKGTSNDHYLSGSYLGPLPEAMRGLRVVLSPSIDAGKALLADTSHSEMLLREDFNIEMAYAGDDFTKNLVTILGEMRVIPVFRTVGSMRLITPKAP